MKYTKKDYIKRWLKIILNPMYWGHNYKYDKKLDEWLLNALEYCDISVNFASINGYLYEIKLDGKILWVSNYPYAYGTYRTPLVGIFTTHDKETRRASMVNIHRLRERVIELCRVNGLKHD